MKINGYSIFMNDDEAIYCAKSKEDVYDYFVENYGSTEECQNQTKEEFINELIEINPSSECAQKKSTWYNEDEGFEYESSYFKEYEFYANKDSGTYVICFLTW